MWISMQLDKRRTDINLKLFWKEEQLWEESEHSTFVSWSVKWPVIYMMVSQCSTMSRARRILLTFVSGSGETDIWNSIEWHIFFLLSIYVQHSSPYFLPFNISVANLLSQWGWGKGRKAFTSKIFWSFQFNLYMNFHKNVLLISVRVCFWSH